MNHKRESFVFVIAIAVCLFVSGSVLGQPGTVLSHQKISDTAGGFTGTLDDVDHFGRSLALLGDLNNNGVDDMAVGAPLDDDGGTDRGAVWILFLNSDGTVKSHRKISDTQGGFSGTLDDSDWFGFSLASIGDLDGDGVGDLAVGARGDDDGGADRGAVWVLFLNYDGTVRSHQKISNTEGGFTGALDNLDYFGASVTSLGDLDGDGVDDLAAGAPGDDDGGRNRGGVWILLLNPDGTVKSHRKISDAQGGFTGTLDDSDRFGFSLASLGDLDGDGIGDLAVGVPWDDDGGSNRGAVWVLFLNSRGTVRSHQKISDTRGGFTGVLDDSDRFGNSVTSLADLDGDGVGDLAVGAWADEDGGSARGAVWVLFLNSDGMVKSHQKISDTEGGFTGTLDHHDHFASSVASLNDLDGDGVGDLAVGADLDDDGGTARGAVWVLFLDGVSTGTPARLTDFTVLDGTLISGGLPRLRRSDDRYIETEARVTGEVAQPHLMRMRIIAESDVEDPTEMVLTFESHITDVEGTVWLFLRNWRQGELVQVAQFDVGLEDGVEQVTIPRARRFIRTSDGRIKLQIKKIVFFPFTLGGFHSLIDQVQIRVR